MFKKKQTNIFIEIHNKYTSKQKITYEEYVILLSTNDEIWFCYNNKMFQVTHPTEYSVLVYIVDCMDVRVCKGETLEYSNIIEMLQEYKIDGKRICEIWDKVYFK